MSWVAVGVAAAGLIKSYAVDKPKEERQRKLAAETQALSPWTGLSAGPIQEADPLGQTMQYGMAGYGMKQNIADHDQQSKLTDSQITKNNAMSESLSGKPVATPATTDGSIFQNNSYQGQSGVMGNQPRKSPWMLYSSI